MDDVDKMSSFFGSIQHLSKLHQMCQQRVPMVSYNCISNGNKLNPKVSSGYNMDTYQL